MAYGAAGVRAAVKAWFDPPAVDGLNRSYAGMPWWVSGTEFDLKVKSGWGSVCYVHIRDEEETRIGLGGSVQGAGGVNGGLKAVHYVVGLVVMFEYVIPARIPAGQDESSYVLALDALLDSVKVRLRSDHTLGTGPNGIVWQAAEGDGQNNPDIRITRDMPFRSARKIASWQVVEFDLIEIVQN